MQNAKKSLTNKISEKAIYNFQMVSFGVEHRVSNQINGDQVITINDQRSKINEWKFSHQIWSKDNSAGVVATERYSATVEERNTERCFFAH